MSPYPAADGIGHQLILGDFGRRGDLAQVEVLTAVYVRRDPEARQRFVEHLAERT